MRIKTDNEMMNVIPMMKISRISSGDMLQKIHKCSLNNTAISTQLIKCTIINTWIFDIRILSGYQELIQNTREHTTPNCTYYDMAKSVSCVYL